MAGEVKSAGNKIHVSWKKDKTEHGSVSNGLPGSSNPGSKWYTYYRNEIVTKNSVISPDGFSGVIFENIGDDRCFIFNGLPVNPANKTREFLNRPGELITSQIPVQFENTSANKQLSVIYVYYELINK